MQIYTIYNHIDNMYVIEKLVNLFRVKNIQDKFKVLNLLADFLTKNEQYNGLVSYSKVSVLLVETIEYCNGNEFSNKEFDNKFNLMHSELKKLLNEIKQVYEIKLYFSDKDKYNLIENAVSSDINLLKDKDEIYSKKGFKILLSNKEIENQANINKYDLVIGYDKFINDCIGAIGQINEVNYDYGYLSNNIIRAQKSDVDGIVVGLSYSRNGVDMKKINGNYINLSLSSQDIYYAYKIAKEIIDSNNNINKCIIGTGYYSFYLDMSKSVNDGIPRIKNVYYPIFKDSHNFSYTDKTSNTTLGDCVDKYTKYIFKVDEIEKRLSKLLDYNYQGYFDNSKTRKSISLISGIELASINLENKMKLAKERSTLHNKLKKNKTTRDENIKILKKFLEYLISNNVKPILVNFNNTKYYNKFLDKEYIIEFNNIIQDLKVKYKFEFIDLNKYSSTFEDQDFVDFDHLSDTGAVKATEIINRKISCSSLLRTKGM